MSIQSAVLLHDNSVDAGAQDYIDQARQVVVTSNTDTSTNLNNSASTFATNVPLYDTVDLLDGAFTVLATGIQCNFNGRVLVTANAHIYAASARNAIQISFRKNGTADGPIATTGYIRNSSGHNRSSLHLNDYIFNVVSGDVISVGSRRQPGSTVTGATTLIEAGTSNICLRRLT